MNIKKIFLNFIYELLSQVVTIGLGLIVPRLVLVGYGSEINGLLNSVTQFIVYLYLFEAGIQTVAKQALYKPVKLDDKEGINRILSAVDQNYRKMGSLYLFFFIALSLVYPLVIKDSNISYSTGLFVFLFSGLGNVLVFFFHGKYWVLLKAEGKNYILANIQTIISVLNNVVKIILLQKGMNVVVVLFATFVVSLLQVVYIYFYIKKHYSWINLKLPPDYSALSEKNSGLIHQIAGMVFQNTDVLILTVVCGLNVVSVYSLYKMITSHLDSILNSIYNSGSFALGQLFNTNKQQYIKIIDMVEVYFSGVVFSVYSVTYAMFIPFVSIYTRGIQDIQYADVYLGALFVIIGLLTYSRHPMINTINYAGHFTKTLPQTIAELIINLTVSIVAVFFLGIYGVLIGTVIALLYRTVDVIIYANHMLLNRSAKKTFSIYIVNTSIFILFSVFIKKLGLNIVTYFDFVKWGFVLCLAVFTTYLTVLSLIYKNERKILTSIITSKIKKKHYT